MSALAQEHAPAVTPIEWRLSVPGVPSVVQTARRLVRMALGGSPRAGDVELIASELVTNAIRHTNGSAVTLRLLVEPGQVRVEVLDLGRVSWVRPATPADDDECGRGLLIVDALADRAGHDPVPLGRLSWAEVSWSEPAGRHTRRRDTTREDAADGGASLLLTGDRARWTARVNARSRIAPVGNRGPLF